MVGYNKTTMNGSFYHNKKKGRKTTRMADQEWIRLEDVTDEIREQYNLYNL